MSAFFRAGESLTPSPVTATTLPALWTEWPWRGAARYLVSLHDEQFLLGTGPGEGDLRVAD